MCCIKDVAISSFCGMMQIDEEACVCEAMVTVPLDGPKLLMLELAQKVAAASIIRHTKGKRQRRLCPEGWILVSLYSDVTCLKVLTEYVMKRWSSCPN